MSIVDISQDLMNVSDERLRQLLQGGDENYPRFLVATEAQRRKDIRARYDAQLKKHQGEQPPIVEALANEIPRSRSDELGILGVDPNMGPGDPSLQAGIAGPPSLTAAGGGYIPRYQQGGGPLGENTDQYYSDMQSEDLIEEEPARLPVGIPEGVVERAGHGRRPQLAAFERIGRTLEAQAPHWANLAQMKEELDELRATRPRYGMQNPMTPRERTLRAEYKSLERDLDMAGIPRPAAPATEEERVARQELDITTVPFGDDQIEAFERRREEANEAPDAEGGGLQSAIDQIMGAGGGGGLNLPSGMEALYDDMGIKIEDYRTRQQDPDRPESLESERIRREIGAREFSQAQGIRALEQDRMKEQESLLADRLGLSEERVRELQGEMDTPDELEARRRASVLSNIGATLMGSPRELGAGFKGVTDELSTLDDLIKGERATQLEGIHTERTTADALEDLKRGEIYDLTRSSQMGLDSADIKQRKIDADIAQERADLGLAGEDEALDAYMRLAESKARQAGAWSASMASLQGAMREATLNKENFLADPANWENIMNRHADQLSIVEGDAALSEAQRLAATKNLNEQMMALVQALGFSTMGQINEIMASQGSPQTTSQYRTRENPNLRVSQGSGQTGL